MDFFFLCLFVLLGRFKITLAILRKGVFLWHVGCLLIKSLCSYEKDSLNIYFLFTNFIIGAKSLSFFQFGRLGSQNYTKCTNDISTKSWHRIITIFRNRRSREASVLKAIENGAETLFDIVADVYSENDRRLWIPAASNVRLHVDHLSQQDMLPKVTFWLLQHRHFQWLYIFAY